MACGTVGRPVGACTPHVAQCLHAPTCPPPPPSLLVRAVPEGSAFGQGNRPCKDLDPMVQVRSVGWPVGWLVCWFRRTTRGKVSAKPGPSSLET